MRPHVSSVVADIYYPAIIRLLLAAGACAACSAEPTAGLTRPISAEREGAVGKGYFDLLGTIEFVTYEVRDGRRITGGDVLLGEALSLSRVARLARTGTPLAQTSDDRVGAAALPLLAVKAKYLWPGGVIPYVISADLAAAAPTIEAAMAHVMERTPLRFVRRDQQSDYISVELHDTCGGLAHVGLERGGKRIVNVSLCSAFGVVVHELGHVIGLRHEHQRPDRDQYVTIRWDNIEKRAKPWFEKHQGMRIIGEYRTTSIMHYPPYAFAKSAGAATITAKDGSGFAWQRDGLSDEDGTLVRLLYGAGWCTFGRFGTGDFDGDGDADLYCHQEGVHEVRLSNGDATFADGVISVGEFCPSTGQRFGVGDFDGDGKDDHFCHDLTNGRSWVRLSNGDGTFQDPAVWVDAWCSGAAAQIGVGDFDGDDKDDFFCHATPRGAGRVILSNGDGTFSPSIEWTDKWCSGANGRLGVGDFDGDGKDDHFCHNSKSGASWVIFSDGDGTFSRATKWTDKWCSGRSGRFGVGDFDGDGKDDHFCHNSRSGASWVIFSDGDGTFSRRVKWTQTWCSGQKQFGAGDFNGDGKDDHFCHSGKSGASWVIFSDGDGTFSGHVQWTEPGASVVQP